MSTKTTSSKTEAQKNWVDNSKIPDPVLGTKPITGEPIKNGTNFGRRFGLLRV